MVKQVMFCVKDLFHTSLTLHSIYDEVSIFETICPTYFLNGTPKKGIIMQRKPKRSAKRQLDVQLIVPSSWEFTSDPMTESARLKTVWSPLDPEPHEISFWLSKGCFSCRWPVSCSWGPYQRPKTKFIPKGVGSFFLLKQFQWEKHS